MKELRLMKGNEALAEAAIRAGADAYFGYPITPQSEVIEYLMAENPAERTGMVVLQAESELAAINMVYGAAGCGKKAMTSSSSPGISLKMEGISYIAGAELPCLIVNVVRGGPGLGTIQPSQSDYFQAVKGGGHGDYKLIVLAPATVQETVDYVKLGFDLAFKYRNPVMILSDGIIGQMMEKVELFEQQARSTEEPEWATVGKKPGRDHVIVTSLQLQSEEQEKVNLRLQAKYREIEKNEVRYETIMTEDAEYLFVAFGSAARITRKAMEMARAKGIKVGLLRPQTLFPYPYEAINKLADQVKGILTVEMNAGQMVEDVRLAVNGKVKVEHFGRFGGMIPNPDEILNALEQKIIGG
ncbi:MAG: 3-methyl-2-oxobutanoate dehydrogenase subunit VorB [Bacteroidales bacterium]|jgi:2-oxoglutarate ferredoxin oxidoreductase subunit alpha|nr:3-methyl-2-oxobutanoate dehydrogenase subunit VorB [Bacteroidales bacterium]